MKQHYMKRRNLTQSFLALAAFAASPCAAVATQEAPIPKQEVKPVEQVEEDLAFFEKKYRTKIAGVKPKSEYPDPDEFYSAIGKRLGIPEIAWNAAAKKYGWRKDDGKHTFTMLKGGPVAGAAQGSWEVMFIRSTINPVTNKPDPATMQQVMVRIDYDGNVTFPMDPPADAKKADARELAGEWRLASWQASDGAELTAVDFSTTLAFEEGKVRGKAPVNSYGGEKPAVTGGGNEIAFGQMMCTRMAAFDEKLNKAESRYFQLLERTKSYKIEEDKLVFKDKDGKPILSFAKQP